MTNRPYNNTLSWSNTANDAVIFTFVEDGIKYVYTKAYNRGTVQVTIDGLNYANIDLYAPTSSPYDHQW